MKDLKYWIAIALIAASFVLLIIRDMDKEIEKECSSCTAEYSWCASYWAENDLCGR